MYLIASLVNAPLLPLGASRRARGVRRTVDGGRGGLLVRADAIRSAEHQLLEQL